MRLSSAWLTPKRSLPLGRYSRNQAVGVFVAGPLPGTVRVGEVHADAQSAGKSLWRAISLP